MDVPSLAEFQSSLTTFRTRLEAFVAYPAGIVKGEGKITGSAFFPGGDGLVYPRTDRVPDIVVVGHDFGSLCTYEKARSDGAEDIEVRTWGNLRSLLHDAGIADERCYFTNAFVGYREHGPDHGKYPARREVANVKSPFRLFCQELLREQLEAIRPRAVIVLGRYPARFLASVFTNDLPAWRTLKKFEQYDAMRPQILSLRVKDREQPAKVGLLAHPSLPNNWRRKYEHPMRGVLSGRDAEIALLRKMLT